MTTPPMKARDPTAAARDRIEPIAQQAIGEPWKRRDAVEAIMREYSARLAKKNFLEADEWLEENIAYMTRLAAEKKQAHLSVVGKVAAPATLAIKAIYDYWSN